MCTITKDYSIRQKGITNRGTYSQMSVKTTIYDPLP